MSSYLFSARRLMDGFQTKASLIGDRHRRFYSKIVEKRGKVILGCYLTYQYLQLVMLNRIGGYRFLRHMLEFC